MTLTDPSPTREIDHSELLWARIGLAVLAALLIATVIAVLAGAAIVALVLFIAQVVFGGAGTLLRWAAY